MALRDGGETHALLAVAFAFSTDPPLARRGGVARLQRAVVGAIRRRGLVRRWTLGRRDDRLASLPSRQAFRAVQSGHRRRMLDRSAMGGDGGLLSELTVKALVLWRRHMGAGIPALGIFPARRDGRPHLRVRLWPLGH